METCAKAVLLSCIFMISAGCTTLQNNRLPFSAFANKELALQRPCVLYEYAASRPFMGGQLRTYWQDGAPTELAYDDRMFARPAKTVRDEYGNEASLYPVSDYHNRVYELWEFDDSGQRTSYEEFCKPYRFYELPPGTRVFISRVYTYNGIDSINHMADGFVTIPGTSRRVKFTYTFASPPGPRHGTLSEYIGRAPWEDESVPAKRFVGANGKMYKP